MALLSVILNLPWTALGLVGAIISLPRNVAVHQRPFALVLKVRSFWWLPQKGVRATTTGSVVLLGSHLEPKDLEHELVHVAQYNHRPFVFAFLYALESLRHGNRHNKYELAAYETAGNVYKTG
jgi:hypothetical protein